MGELVNVFMFSGQGSQYYQMGRELYHGHPRFRYWMDHCDEIVRPMIRSSLKDLLYGEMGKGETFDRLLHSNPALVSIQFSMATALMEKGIVPDLLLGYSLGEIAAAVVAEGISLESGIGLVVEVARLLEDKGVPARLLAVLEPLEITYSLPHLFRGCWVIGKNFPGNFVVAGGEEAILRLHQALSESKKVSQLLPVRYGFHTEMIDPLGKEIKIRMAGAGISPYRFPVASSCRAEVIRRPDADYFWDVFRRPVEFESTVRGLLRAGDHDFIDVGPSGSLAMFVKYILPSGSLSRPFPILNPFGRDLSALDRLSANFTGTMKEPQK